MMALVRRPYAYSKIDTEDPEEKMHQRAQFLIYKTLEQADSRRRPSYMRVRICRLKIKIGRRLKKLRKISMLLNISVAKVLLYRQVLRHLKTWKPLFCSEENMVSLPPLIT